MTSKFSVTDFIAELARQHAHFAKGSLPDLRKLATMSEGVNVNDSCADTGLTPLLWTIENDSPLFSFLMSRQVDLSAVGTGEFAITPVEFALSKGLMQRAEQLVERGAACPPEIAARIDERRKANARADKELRDIERKLERGLKSPGFTAVAAQFAERLGVDGKKVRGRKGHLSFKAVPVRKLASESGEGEASWLYRLNAEASAAGASLFAAAPIGEKAKYELCLAPTNEKRHVVAISQLLTGEMIVPRERMQHADRLDGLAEGFPFALISCGRWGVFGKPEPMPKGVNQLAERLFDICEELLGHYYMEHQDTSSVPLPKPDRDLLVPILASDIEKDGVFWLPWGVDL